jgi:hypothetical protein
MVHIFDHLKTQLPSPYAWSQSAKTFLKYAQHLLLHLTITKLYNSWIRRIQPITRFVMNSE